MDAADAVVVAPEVAAAGVGARRPGGRKGLRLRQKPCHERSTEHHPAQGEVPTLLVMKDLQSIIQRKVKCQLC